MNVTMLGTGNMGSALAKAFIGDGLVTTVWNRTLEKTRPLGAIGALIAEDLPSAVTASPIVVICVDRNDHVTDMLNRAHHQLRDRVVVNLTWGTAAEANSLAELVMAAGGDYLAGALFAYPNEIATDAAKILVSGAAEVYERAAQMMNSLGRVSRVGDRPADSTVAATASAAIFYHTALGGLFEGLALASRMGLPPRRVIEYMHDAVATLVHSLDFIANAIDANDYATDQATVEVHRDALRMAQAELNAASQPGPFTATMVQLMDDACSAGRGQQSVASLYTVLAAT